MGFFIFFCLSLMQSLDVDVLQCVCVVSGLMGPQCDRFVS